MKKTFWKWFTTPIGCDSYYDYWNKQIEKGNFDGFFEQFKWYLKNSLKMKQITQEQHDELLAKQEERIIKRSIYILGL